MPGLETAADEIPIHIDNLRAAIRANRVNFPVPVPVFARQHRPEVQWRLVELYFVHGWSPERLAGRYHITRSRVRQALRCWVARAKAAGYLQTVPAEKDIRFEIAVAAHATGSLPDVAVDHFTGLLTVKPQTLHTHA